MGVGSKEDELFEDVAGRREELVGEVKLAFAKLSSVMVMFRGAVAVQHGLSRSEERVLTLLERSGRLTASDLARRLRLAPSSITDLVGRMEQKRLIRREPSLRDRRSLLISLNRSHAPTLSTIHEDFAGRLEECLARYTDEQLELVLDLFRQLSRAQSGAMGLAGR